MVWFYKREDVSLSLETRFDDKASEYSPSFAILTGIETPCGSTGSKRLARGFRRSSSGWMQNDGRRMGLRMFSPTADLISTR